MAETEGKAQEAPSQKVQEEWTLAMRRKGVQQGGETNTELRQPEDPRKGCRKIRQEKIEAAKKLPLPGYQGPAEELQEDHGKSPERLEEPGEGGSTSRPPPNRGANKPLRGPREELQESPAKELRKGPLEQRMKSPVKERQGDPAGELQRGSPSSPKEDSGDEEEEKRTTDQEGSGERRSGKDAPNIRTPSPAEELQECPGHLSGHREGPGGGGAPQDERTSRGPKEEPPLTGVQTSLRKDPGRSCW